MESSLSLSSFKLGWGLGHRLRERKMYWCLTRNYEGDCPPFSAALSILPCGGLHGELLTLCEIVPHLWHLSWKHSPELWNVTARLGCEGTPVREPCACTRGRQHGHQVGLVQHKASTAAAWQRNRLVAWSRVSCWPQEEPARRNLVSACARRVVGKGRAAADPPLRAPSFFSRVSARSGGIRGSREGAVVLKKTDLEKNRVSIYHSIPSYWAGCEIISHLSLDRSQDCNFMLGLGGFGGN